MGMIFLRIGILSRGAYEAKLESAWQVGHDTARTRSKTPYGEYISD